MNTRSPFPGMDPYLERHWRDVHAPLVVLARAALQKQLAGDLRACVEERLVIGHDGAKTRDVNPAVRVVESQYVPVELPSSATVVATKPLIIPWAPEPFEETLIEIRDNEEDDRWADTLLRSAGKR